MMRSHVQLRPAVDVSMLSQAAAILRSQTLMTQAAVRMRQQHRSLATRAAILRKR